jgi:hypothetical protein
MAALHVRQNYSSFERALRHQRSPARVDQPSTQHNLADLITIHPAIYHQALSFKQQQHRHSRLDVDKTSLTERRW